MNHTKVRILFVTDFFYPHWTGISKSLYYITTSLQCNFDITVLTVRFDSKLKPYEKIQNISIYRDDYLFTFSRSKYSISIILHFLKIVNQFDVIFVNSPCSNILPITLISKLFGKKIVCFHQGDLILPHGVVNKAVEYIFDVSTIFSFALMNKISTYTSDYAIHSRVMRYFLPKFTPLLPPLPTYKSTIKNKLLNNLKKGGKILFGFGGRFVEEKGFDILLQAIPLVLKKLPNAHFVFAGDTNIQYENFFHKLKPLINTNIKHITFLGLLSGNKLQAFYEAVDFILVPSRSDCFPLIQAEAMLAGKPSVVTNIPGARTPVQQTGFGSICDTENIIDLAEAIVTISSNKHVQKNRSKVSELFNNNVNEQKIKEYLTF